MEISLNSRKYPGLVAIIDDEDEPLLASVRTWSVKRNHNTFYAHGCLVGIAGCPLVLMHRLILPGYPMLDHRDGNGLNNRRANLRPCTAIGNGANRRPDSDNTSGFKGVFREGRRWKAQIRHRNRFLYLGTFDAPADAALAYDRAASEIHGDFARLNFPSEVPR